MGFSISWLALNGPSSAHVLERLAAGLKSKDSKIVELPSGWRVLQVRRCDHPLVKDDSLRRLSSGSDVIAVSVEEHVMFSMARRWENGLKTWCVAHQGDCEDRRNLREEGHFPPGYAEIKRRCFDLQAKEELNEDDLPVDYIFEVPLELANAIVGYRHDGYGLTEEPRPRLARKRSAQPKKRPAHGALAFGGTGVAIAVALAVVWLALECAGLRRGVVPSVHCYGRGAQLLITLPSFLGAIPIGLLLMNLVVYAIPPFRRAFDRWAEIDQTPGFGEANLQLCRLICIFSPLCFALAFAAAIFG